MFATGSEEELAVSRHRYNKQKNRSKKNYMGLEKVLLKIRDESSTLGKNASVDSSL